MEEYAMANIFVSTWKKNCGGLCFCKHKEEDVVANIFCKHMEEDAVANFFVSTWKKMWRPMFL
jgi:hypothetical protein